jgi:DNA-binding NarL/FixJ family response regulator
MGKHMEKLIHLAIVDDHRIFRDGMRMALKDRELICIDWEAENGKEMIEKLKLQKPDVLILDIKMPETDGVKALQLIRKEYDDVKIIILSMYDDRETIAKMMEYGANAYLTKMTDADEIYRAINGCVKEGFYFNDLVNGAVLVKLQNNKSLKRFYPNKVKFNENEMKILKLISEDKTTEEISQEIFLSPRTVESLRQNMKNRVGAKTIAGLLMYAIRNRLID